MLIQYFEDFEGNITSVQFSTKGDRFVAGSSDHTYKVYCMTSFLILNYKCVDFMI